MVSFFVCLAILIIGFMVYSKFTEKVFGPDDRKPPALTMTDGSDYVPMSTPRIFLIQLLNIAGLGPVSYTHLDVYKRQSHFRVPALLFL